MASNAANGAEIARVLATIAGALSGQQPNQESSGTASPNNLLPATASTSGTCMCM